MQDSDSPSDTVHVTFLPDARRVAVPKGETLLVAAWKAGVPVKAACGGRAKCGSCLVRVRSDVPNALTAATQQEMALLPPLDDQDAGRLACMARTRGDVHVSLPAHSRAPADPPRKPYPEISGGVASSVRRVSLNVADAQAKPLRPVAARIAAALKAANHGRAKLVPAALAEFSRDVTFVSRSKISATIADGHVIRLSAGASGPDYGLAVDIGTMSVVAFLCHLESGKIFAVRTAVNPQFVFGDDVASRLDRLRSDRSLLLTMRRMLVDEINVLMKDMAQGAGIAPADIVSAVAVGNPAMQHILLGMNPAGLGQKPSQLIYADEVAVDAASLGLDIFPRAPVFVLPAVSAAIGGDTLAALLTRAPKDVRGSSLFIDIGTHDKLVLSRKGRLTATSCTSGPYFEAAHITCGVRAAPGAVERVWIDPDGSIEWSAISGSDGDCRPIGLCGSGVISAVAACVRAGLVGSNGVFAPVDSHPALRLDPASGHVEVVLVPGTDSSTGRDIVLTQDDVRSVQKGKAILRAGIDALLRDQKLDVPERIYLAGTFGNYLAPGDLVDIGMLPPVALDRIEVIGNAAGSGACMALLNRHARARARRLANSLRVIEVTEPAKPEGVFAICTELSVSIKLPRPRRSRDR